MTILPDAAWRRREGLAGLLAALDAPGGATRFVGGAVRDTLLGLPVTDVDMATRLAPEVVIERVRAAGFKAVPTGLAHGTVTAVIPSGPIEVTTLRRDVATDGRHAVVAFTDDWREDAARRDFTFNALFAEPASGRVIDYFDGLADLAARRVRFIGDPLVRIAEDHLRILRFFRFHARFGRGAPDAEGLAACAARARDLMALSRERIADELLKLLALPDPGPTVALMIDAAILAPVLPEIDAHGVARLRRTIDRERDAAVPADETRRLAALLPRDAALADAIGARLRLSNRRRERLRRDVDPAPLPALEAAYRFGAEIALDRLLLADAPPYPALIDRLTGWRRPELGLTGGALIARGLTPGPIVAATLQAIERRWIAEGFPDRDRVLEITDAALADARP